MCITFSSSSSWCKFFSGISKLRFGFLSSRYWPICRVRCLCELHRFSKSDTVSFQMRFILAIRKYTTKQVHQYSISKLKPDPLKNICNSGILERPSVYYIFKFKLAMQIHLCNARCSGGFCISILKWKGALHALSLRSSHLSIPTLRPYTFEIDFQSQMSRQFKWYLFLLSANTHSKQVRQYSIFKFEPHPLQNICSSVTSVY